MTPRSLTDLEVTVDDIDPEYEHADVTIEWAAALACWDEDVAAEFGHPTEANLLGAALSAASLLARLAWVAHPWLAHGGQRHRCSTRWFFDEDPCAIDGAPNQRSGCAMRGKGIFNPFDDPAGWHDRWGRAVASRPGQGTRRLARPHPWLARNDRRDRRMTRLEQLRLRHRDHEHRRPTTTATVVARIAAGLRFGRAGHGHRAAPSSSYIPRAANLCPPGGPPRATRASRGHPESTT